MRASGIDELPQLLNVLLGERSLMLDLKILLKTPFAVREQIRDLRKQYNIKYGPGHGGIV